MSGKYARVVRRTTARELKAVKAKDVEVVKTFLSAVSSWPLKDRILMAFRITFGRFKKNDKRPA